MTRSSSTTFAWFSLAASVLIAMLSLGCGRANRVYPDPKPASPSVVTPVSTEELALLPRGFYDQSVNRAVVSAMLSGGTGHLRLRTFAGENPAGGFNGDGLGNRALLGLGSHAGTKLSELGSITFDFKAIKGDERVSIALVVDLDCGEPAVASGGSSDTILVTASSTRLGEGATLPEDLSRIEAFTSDSLWQTSAADLTDPSDPSITLLHSESSATASSLDAVIARFPQACILNSASGAHALPLSVPTAGILFALGEPDTVEESEVEIHRISIGPTIYSDLAQSAGEVKP